MSKRLLIITNMGMDNKYCDAVPKTFCAPLHVVADAVVHQRMPGWKSLFSSNQVALYVLWTLSLESVFLLLIPRGRLKLVSVFQWGDLASKGAMKNVLYNLILRRSDAFVVFDSESKVKVEKFGRTIPIGVCVDYNFFQPSRGSTKKYDVVVVGSHNRDEALVRAIADNFKVVRVTQNSQTRCDYVSNPHPNVEVRFDTSYEELKAIYDCSRVALVPVTDTAIPVGVTAYYEAIAMMLPIVAKEGASTGGFLVDKATLKMKSSDPKMWTEAIRKMLEQNLSGELEDRRRRAADLSSIEGLTKIWRNVVRPFT